MTHCHCWDIAECSHHPVLAHAYYLCTDCAMSWIGSPIASTQKLMPPIDHEIQSELVAMAEVQTASPVLNFMAHGRVVSSEAFLNARFGQSLIGL